MAHTAPIRVDIPGLEALTADLHRLTDTIDADDNSTAGIAVRAIQLMREAGEQRDRNATERDGAYRERAQLLAWLAALHPAVIAPAPDVAEDGWQILFLNPAAGGQMSWHIAPRDAELFEHVEHVPADDPRAQWDGHTTEEKYQRIRSMPFGKLLAWCGASMPGVGAAPIGPCILRHGHDGPVHQAASGAKWWPEQTLTVRDLTPPMPVSTELVDEAEADGGGLYATVMRMFGGTLPPHEPAPLCWCGAQPFAGGVIHNTGCPWKNERVPADPGPLRDLAARALTEEQPEPIVIDARPPYSPGDFLPGYHTEADFDAAPPPQFTGILGPFGITPDQCRAEYHRSGYPDSRCDLPPGHPEYHRDWTRLGAFRWDDSVAMYPTTPEDDR